MGRIEDQVKQSDERLKKLREDLHNVLMETIDRLDGAIKNLVEERNSILIMMTEKTKQLKEDFQKEEANEQ